MKKNIIIILLLISTFLITACNNKVENKDALKFKEEYEKINNTKTSSGKITRELSIPEDNPFIYKTAREINELIENEETFLVYFGFASCPWCRGSIESLIQAAQEKSLTQIYYVDVYDIRSSLKLDENNKVVTVKEGSADYYKLLKNLDNVLNDYNLTTSSGTLVPTNEKRLYAPSIVSIVKGKATLLETGITQKETDPYMELSSEIKSTKKDLFIKVIKEVTQSNICTPDGC